MLNLRVRKAHMLISDVCALRKLDSAFQPRYLCD